jgi:hypothetical protein
MSKTYLGSIRQARKSVEMVKTPLVEQLSVFEQLRPPNHRVKERCQPQAEALHGAHDLALKHCAGLFVIKSNSALKKITFNWLDWMLLHFHRL